MFTRGYHQYTPFMIAYIPAPWILWVWKDHCLWTTLEISFFKQRRAKGPYDCFAWLVDQTAYFCIFLIILWRWRCAVLPDLVASHIPTYWVHIIYHLSIVYDIYYIYDIWYIYNTYIIYHMSHAGNLDRFLGRKNMLTHMLAHPYAIGGFSYAGIWAYARLTRK